MAGLIDISSYLRRKIMIDPGGDALDAVLAAVGGWRSWEATDHAAVRSHVRYPKEGLIFP